MSEGVYIEPTVWYKITVKTVQNIDDKNYPVEEEVYSQQVGDLDLPAVIAAVNKTLRIDNE